MFNRSTEMAPLLGLRRNDRHGPPQLCRTGRHPWSDRRCDVHFLGSAHYRVLRRHLRLQRVEVEDEERGRVVLRQVRTYHLFVHPRFGSVGKRRVAFV